MSTIAADYLAGRERTAPFFARDPRLLFDQPPMPREWSADFVAGMLAYQRELGLERSIAGNEAVIVTGQQPGIFTGPLYTIYKAATAIRLARRIRERFGVPCIPVFWVGSEDHDFDEARSAHFLSKRHDPFTLIYEPKSDVAGRPLYRVPVEPSLHALVDRAAENSPGSEFRAEVTKVLHQTLDAASSLSDWAARLLAHLFRDTDLLLFSPHLEFARRASTQVLLKEISDPLVSTRLTNEAGRRLAAEGYDPQLIRSDADCSFFVEVDGRRRKVSYGEDSYHVLETGLSYTVKELLALLESEPTRFSPNVALRCIVQQHLFAPEAYVAGPGEVAYWAQLKSVFEHFHSAMPVVYPRARAVLTSIKLNKLRSRVGLDFAALEQPFEALLERVLETSADSVALSEIRARRDEFKQVVDRLALALESRDKRLAVYIPSLRERIEFELERLERAVMRADEVKVDTARQQLARLCNTLAPWRRPQERVFTVFSYLFEHGWDLIARIVEDIDVDPRVPAGSDPSMPARFGLTEIEL